MWPSIDYDVTNCNVKLQTSLTYLGMQRFGQTVNYEDGYMEIDTMSSDLSSLTGDALVLVQVKAALIDTSSEEELVSESIQFSIKFE